MQTTIINTLKSLANTHMVNAIVKRVGCVCAECVCMGCVCVGCVECVCVCREGVVYGVWGCVCM